MKEDQFRAKKVKELKSKFQKVIDDYEQGRIGVLTAIGLVKELQNEANQLKTDCSTENEIHLILSFPK